MWRLPLLFWDQLPRSHYPLKMPCLHELVKQIVIKHASSLLDESVTTGNLASVHCQPFHFVQISSSVFVCFCINFSTSLKEKSFPYLLLKLILKYDFTNSGGMKTMLVCLETTTVFSTFWLFFSKWLIFFS